MPPRPSTEPGHQDAGFITPVFVGLVLFLSLVAAAIVMLARQDFLASRHDARRAAQGLWLEGIATQAAAKLMVTPGQSVLRWTEPSSYGNLVVVVEPEDRKVGPQFVERAENIALIERLVGSRDAADVAMNVSRLAFDAKVLIKREEIARLHADPRWRNCATTMISPYSSLTNLAPDAPDGPLTSSAHRGQIWRVLVTAEDGGWIDQVIRLTDRPAEPLEVLEQVSGRDRRGGRAECWALLDIAGARHDQR